MARQSFPSSSRLRTATRSAKRVYRPVSQIEAETQELAIPIQGERFGLSTLAGRADTVWHSSSFKRSKPLPVPVWRSGYRDGKASKALFNKPTGLAVDRFGSLYVSDSLNHCIRKISPRGKVTTLLGNGERGYTDAPGRKARLNHPTTLAMDGQGRLFIVDQGNRALRCRLPQGELLSLETVGNPVGGLALSGGWLYLFMEIKMRGMPLVVLARISPDTGVNELLAEWEGTLRWLPYRAGEEEQPFSRWWFRRQYRPTPYIVTEAQRAEGMGLAADHKGQLFWLKGLQLVRLAQQGETRTAKHGSAPVSLSLSHLPLKFEQWPSAHWQGLSVDDTGHVYALDAQHHQLFKINTLGDMEVVVSNHYQDLLRPYAVVQDAFGQVYISDTGHWRVCRLVPAGREKLLHLARQAFLPYQPLFRRPQVTKKGMAVLVRKYMQRRGASVQDLESVPNTPKLAVQHVLDVLGQGNRSQQLASVKDVIEHLSVSHPIEVQALLRPVFEKMLNHSETSVRALFIRHLCDMVHSEQDALYWLELLESHREDNRLLKKYLIEVLSFLGKRYELHGHAVPLMVEFIASPEEDVVEYVFQHLHQIRDAGYESLVDPLIEELGAS